MQPSIATCVLLFIWTFSLLSHGLPIVNKDTGGVMCFPVDLDNDIDICFDMTNSVFQIVHREDRVISNEQANSAEQTMSKIKTSKSRSRAKRPFDSINYTSSFGRIG